MNPFTNLHLVVFVEQMPEAGYDVNTWLSQNLVYPKHAWENGIDGRVIVQFVVTEAGCIDSAKVIRSPHPNLSTEEIRLVTNLPQPWKPGKISGKIVRMKYSLPIIFRLE